MPHPKMSTSRFSMAILMAMSLGACATKPAEVAPQDDVPGVRLSIDEAIKRADASKVAMQDATVPASLTGNTMSVIWEGDAAEILKRIALAQHLEFKLTGPQPRLALPVFVKLRGVTLAAALQSIGEQCGGRADVVLNESSIELRSKLY